MPLRCCASWRCRPRAQLAKDRQLVLSPPPKPETDPPLVVLVGDVDAIAAATKDADLAARDFVPLWPAWGNL